MRILSLLVLVTLALPGSQASARVMEVGDAAIVEQVRSAVVNIAEWKVRAATEPGGSPRRIKVYASGFVIDPSGIIVTNKHVVDGALQMHAIFSNGDRAPARLLAAAAMLDLAVLKVDVDHPLPALKWGDSDRLAGRQSGADHGQSAGSRHVGVRRDRQRAQSQSARQSVRRLHPDRRSDQLWQLRRATGRWQWRCRRHRYRVVQSRGGRRLYRHRLRYPVQPRRVRRALPAQSRSSKARMDRRHLAGHGR